MRSFAPRTLVVLNPAIDRLTPAVVKAARFIKSLRLISDFSPRVWKGGALQAAEKLSSAYDHPGAQGATPPESGGELLKTLPSSDEEGWRAERRGARISHQFRRFSLGGGAFKPQRGVIT
jgi:hypothetical protein